MRRLWPILFLLMIASAFATDHYHRIQISAGTVSIDSVVLRKYVYGTIEDSVRFSSFPVIDSMLVSDTIETTIYYWYYFTDDAGAYTTAFETIEGNPTNLASVAGADAYVTWKAVDTSNGADTTIQGVSVSIYNTSDMRIAFGTTLGNGQFIFGLKSGDTCYANATQPIGWVWSQADTFIVSNAYVDSSQGYKFAGTAPASGKVCATTIFVRDNDNTAEPGVLVTARLARSNLIDSSGTPIANVTKSDKTDSDGKVTLDLMWSSYLIPATDWIITIHTPGSGGVQRPFTIPRQTTLTLDLTQ